ncbi:MAG: hypothetical protein MUF49_00170 [Oculatellaceae cyanobacterium Prado106]|jgi:hypothetical protein|nr:hypothetical protein [Oculatellaceae cyanobacterium Prado106]
MDSPTFTLSETSAFGNGYLWQLQASEQTSELLFQKTSLYEVQLLEQIPVSTIQITAFQAALNLLDVWHWRENYSSEEISAMVLDGSSWSFSAEFADQKCCCQGHNAYPAFVSPMQTVLRQERFALLLAAMGNAFSIDQIRRC